MIPPVGPSADETRARFGRIAPGYDRANSVLSFGIHHYWRKKLIRFADLLPGMKVLDCATGTGDLAIGLQEKLGTNGEVIGTDFCPEMLFQAREKARRTRLPIKFQVADAMALPFPDECFDRVTIAFGIRNVERPTIALREFGRVTKPGGMVLVLEFGRPVVPLWRELFGAFSRNVLPRVGGWIAGDRSAYEYLHALFRCFPLRREFLAAGRRNGLLWKGGFYPSHRRRCLPLSTAAYLNDGEIPCVSLYER